MKRIRKFTAAGKNVKIILHMEVVTTSDTWDRSAFIQQVDAWSDKIVFCLAGFGIRLRNIKHK